MNGNTLTGNVTITSSTVGTVNISAGRIAGNLTVNTANATVNNTASVNGTITITDVAIGTWNENANGNKIVVNDTTGITLNIGAGKTVNSLTLNQPTTVIVPAGANVTTLTVEPGAANSTITNNGTVTNLVANAVVEVEGKAPGNVTGNPGDVTVFVSVDNQQALENALNNSNITNIVLTKDIETTSQFLVKQAGQTIDGAGHTISAATGMHYQNPNKSVLTVLNANGVTISKLNIDASKVNTANKWDGVYAAQVYDATGVTLKDVTVTGADGGILVNASEVEVTGKTTVSGNEFGGIEVSKGKEAGLFNSVLNVKGTLVNSSEAYGQPTIWLVTGEGTVTGGPITINTNIKPGQTQYYQVEGNAFLRAEVTYTSPEFVANEASEFTVTTKANDDASKMVKAYFELPENVNVEYHEINNNQWYPLGNEYGPSEGFPLSDATSKFRATFSEAGQYTLTVTFKTLDGKVVATREMTFRAVAE